MNVFITGLGFRETPLEIRESLAFSGEQLEEALQAVQRLPFVKECALISTCNRTEMVVFTGQAAYDARSVENTLCQVRGMAPDPLRKHFYEYAGHRAIRHLFRVAAGLDSLVLGEDQILRQVKDAGDAARKAGTAGTVINTLFQQAVTSAKKIKTGTGLSRHRVSVGSLALEHLEDMFGQGLEGRTAMIIGLGKMGQVVYQHLRSMKLEKIYVTNRSRGRIECFCDIGPQVEIIEYTERMAWLSRCDMVISSTSSPHYTITKDMVCQHAAPGRSMAFVDLAVPRDIDEGVAELPDMSYMNIDRLAERARHNNLRRQQEAVKADELADEAVDAFEHWLAYRSALPVIREAQTFAERVADERTALLLSRLPGLTEEQIQWVRYTVGLTAGTLMDRMVYATRKHADKDEMENYFQCLRRALEEEEHE